jgi:phosphoheptose isomerase
MKILFILLLSSLSAIGQKYEYAEIFQSQHDVTRTKASFYFGTKYDSLKAYGQFENIIDAMDKADRKGWEVITINTYFIDTTNPSIGQTTVVYIKRKKPKTH